MIYWFHSLWPLGREERQQWVNQGFFVRLPTRACRTGYWLRRDLIDRTQWTTYLIAAEVERKTDRQTDTQRQTTYNLGGGSLGKVKLKLHPDTERGRGLGFGTWMMLPIATQKLHDKAQIRPAPAPWKLIRKHWNWKQTISHQKALWQHRKRTIVLHRKE